LRRTLQGSEFCSSFSGRKSTGLEIKNQKILEKKLTTISPHFSAQIASSSHNENEDYRLPLWHFLWEYPLLYRVVD
jgi:hypothetical protein